ASIVDLFPGATRLQAMAIEATVVTTNKCTYVAYRGPWATETLVRERLIDIVAHELGLDPLQVRLANYVHDGEDAQMITGRSLVGVTARGSVQRGAELID